MEAHTESVEQVKKPYEVPTLVEREDLVQIAEGNPIVAISEGVVPV